MDLLGASVIFDVRARQGTATLRMADEIDLLSTGCLEHPVNEVGHEGCRGVDVAAGLSSFHKRMCFRVVVERVGAESCCLEVGAVVRPRDEGVLGCARDEHDGMGAFPRLAGEVVGARDLCAGVFLGEPDCRGSAGHAWPLIIRGDSLRAVRRGNPAWMFGSDVGRWAGEGGGRRSHGDRHCGKEGCE